MQIWAKCIRMRVTQIKSVSTQILLQEKLSGAFKYRQNHSATDPAAELRALPAGSVAEWWLGLAAASSKTLPLLSAIRPL